MTNPIKILVQDYSWVHLSLGLLGNTLFFIGSILFLPIFPSWYTFAVWLFIIGSLLMLVGALGRLLVDVFDPS